MEVMEAAWPCSTAAPTETSSPRSESARAKAADGGGCYGNIGITPMVNPVNADVRPDATCGPLVICVQ